MTRATTPTQISAFNAGGRPRFFRLSGCGLVCAACPGGRGWVFGCPSGWAFGCPYGGKSPFCGMAILCCGVKAPGCGTAASGCGIAGGGAACTGAKGWAGWAGSTIVKTSFGCMGAPPFTHNKIITIVPQNPFLGKWQGPLAKKPRAIPHKEAWAKRRADLLGRFHKKHREYCVYSRAFLGNRAGKDASDAAVSALCGVTPGVDTPFLAVIR